MCLVCGYYAYLAANQNLAGIFGLKSGAVGAGSGSVLLFNEASAARSGDSALIGEPRRRHCACEKRARARNLMREEDMADSHPRLGFGPDRIAVGRTGP
jgi:hypothetical protein